MDRQRLQRIARYALFDAGNSNYVTLVASLAFPIYFKSLCSWGSAVDLAWAALLLIATIAAAVLGPIIGAVADRRGAKFRLLRRLSLAAIGGTTMLAAVKHPGLLAGIFVLTETCYLLAIVLYDSALADVSTAEDAADVSSLAWATGYAGGLVGILISLATHGPAIERQRRMFCIAALMFLSLGAPLILAKEQAKSPSGPASEGPALFAPVREFMRDRTRRKLFWAFFLYSNAVSAIIYFTSLYASTTLKYGMDDLLLLFLAMNAVAVPGSIAFGKAAHRYGQLPTLKLVVALWVVVVVAVALSGKSSFALLACLAATLLGPVQALSRSLFRAIFPDDSMSAFFGVQALAARSSALVGPLLFGLVSWITGSQRLGAMSAALLFAAGLAVLSTLREVR